MIERDRYPAGVPCWVDTRQPDPKSAVAFYGGLFGWEFEDSPGYRIARLQGHDVAGVGAPPEGPAPVVAWSTYVAVTSADDAARRARDAGGRVLAEPFDIPEMGRMAVLADPGGAVLSVWEARGHIGAAMVNEPGSLNFNGLATRDVEGAKAFYGAVFGWETLDLDGALMWTLPGYGDFLERRNPGLRARLTEMEVAGAFADVVATIEPIGDDRPDDAPRWTVTFAVEDADAVAAKAYELGARIEVPPFDAPWVRMTVITDPQGATFTATKFVPENRDVAAGAESAATAA